LLESLLHPPCGHRPQAAVHLGGGLSKNQADNGLACNVDGLKFAEDVNLGIGEDNAGSAGVLNGKFCLAILAGYAADSTGKMVSVECPDILDS